jgi:hypothetical protein
VAVPKIRLCETLSWQSRNQRSLLTKGARDDEGSPRFTRDDVFVTARNEETWQSRNQRSLLTRGDRDDKRSLLTKGARDDEGSPRFTRDDEGSPRFARDDLDLFCW